MTTRPDTQWQKTAVTDRVNVCAGCENDINPRVQHWTDGRTRYCFGCKAPNQGAAKAQSRRRDRLAGVQTRYRKVRTNHDTECMSCQVRLPKRALILWHPIDKSVLCPNCVGTTNR